MRSLTVQEIDALMPVIFSVLDEPGSDDLTDEEVWAKVQARLPELDLKDVNLLELMETAAPPINE